TAQLHSYSDPGQNNVLGVLQIRLRQAIGDPNSFDAAGLAHLLQTQGPYVAGAIFDRSGAAVINFSRPDFLSTNTMFFTLATRISSSLATRMFSDPDQFTAVFFTASGPAVAGQLKLAAPPQPDR